MKLFFRSLLFLVIISVPTVTWAQKPDLCEEAALSLYNDTDPTLTTDNSCSDSNTSITSARVSKSNEDMVKMTWNTGYSGLAAGDTITVYLNQLRNAGQARILPYGTSTTVTTGNDIIQEPCTSTPCSFNITLTSGFIGDLADLGSDKFAIRLVATNTDSTELIDRLQITEFDANFTVATKRVIIVD